MVWPVLGCCARMPRTIAAAPLLVTLALLGCADDEAAKPDEVPATVPLTLPTTAEQILTDGSAAPAEEAEPTPATALTTTTLATGLPPALGIPGAGNISLGAGSQISNGLTVREVPFLEVVAFVQTELAALGWEVQAPTVGPGDVVVLDFAGPGAVGQAQLEPRADGTVPVRIVLRGA